MGSRIELQRGRQVSGHGVSEVGSDGARWKVMHVPTRQVLGDEIRWVKYGAASWTHDDKGFFYSRFPEPEAEKKFQGLPLNQKLYYHRLARRKARTRSFTTDPSNPPGASRLRDRRWPLPRYLHRGRHHQPQDSGRLQGFE